MIQPKHFLWRTEGKVGVITRDDGARQLAQDAHPEPERARGEFVRRVEAGEDERAFREAALRAARAGAEGGRRPASAR